MTKCRTCSRPADTNSGYCIICIQNRAYEGNPGLNALKGCALSVGIILVVLFLICGLFVIMGQHSNP